MPRFEKGQRARLRHGMARTPIYSLWYMMTRRCSAPSDRAYHNYGGRGIKVCERWCEFENFLADMGERPSGMSLERIDNDGDYSPENCRWATRKEQARNTRRNVSLTVGGATKCLAEWSEETGIAMNTLWHRLKSGWSPEEIVGTPLVTKRKGIRRGEKLSRHQDGARHGVVWSDEQEAAA